MPLLLNYSNVTIATACGGNVTCSMTSSPSCFQLCGVSVTLKTWSGNSLGRVSGALVGSLLPIGAVDVLITPESASSLFTFAMLDSGVATHSGAPVTFTITGVAAGTTKFQAKYDDKVFDDATVIVKEHIDEETDDLDDDGIADIFDDDIDGDGRIDNTPAKWWSPDTGISGGE